MSKTQFTEGEWATAGDDGGIDAVISLNPPADGGDIICIAPEKENEDSLLRWEHNARLISAAPDLLAALIAIRDTSVDGFKGWAAGYNDAIEKAKAAIAKATL